LRLLKTIGLVSCLALLSSTVGWATTAPKKSATKVSVQKKSSSKAKKSKKSKPKKGAWKRRGQQSIATERTLQIQEALASAGYLRTEPTGKMDAATKQALIKLQKENGWQTKVVPDSRALIKLGLGPDHSNLLNPETAVLPAVSSTAAVQTGSPQ
jgi:peptidoglycan hydrolase-like protein with peptidoglycan-binding domain